MRKPPCVKNGVRCDKRRPGCQDHCPDMQEWNAEVLAEREKRRQERNINEAVFEGRVRLLTESSLQPGGIHHSRKLTERASKIKRSKK